jgi:SH3 domain-containing YSC84-like protein 1
VRSLRKVAAAAVLSFVLIGPALGDGGVNATGAQNVVDQTANTIRALRSNSDFAILLKKAKGIFFVPDLVKGAAILGGSGGAGILLVRSHGNWSDPAFLTIGSISIGAQAGVMVGAVAMFLMTDKATANFTSSNNFSLNGNANLTVVNWSRNGQRSIGKGGVVVWSGTSGLFAGLDVSGSDVHADTSYDRAYYDGNRIGTKQIIGNRDFNGQADKLRTELRG